MAPSDRSLMLFAASIILSKEAHIACHLLPWLQSVKNAQPAFADSSFSLIVIKGKALAPEIGCDQ
jgi:hypothetical protein